MFNLKKHSQEWYTEEIAKTTKDPKILSYILSRGKDDRVSQYAVINPNCPPEALAEVLNRGEDGGVSIYAANNPNCPPEALAEVLSRGKEDRVSYYVANNPNCPPEALVEVLSRGKDDIVSQYSSSNPNCPTKAKIGWMIATGKIEQEDPKKHIIEYEGKEEEDEDLKKLRDMVSSSFNLKK